MIRKNAFLIMPAIFVLGCAHVDSPSNEEVYQRAIADAAVIDQSEIQKLPVITSDKVRVVTWTKYPNSYPENKTTTLSWGEVWVTLEGAVQKHCQAFKPEERLTDIQKLLGLPKNGEEVRSFVTLEVDSKTLFRPCANPSLTADQCGTSFPEGVSEEHTAWFGQQTSVSYLSPEGYPWTRLGYTYNWKRGASEVGPAEFVIKKGAEVKTVSVIGTDEYCSL